METAIKIDPNCTERTRPAMKMETKWYLQKNVDINLYLFVVDQVQEKHH